MLDLRPEFESAIAVLEHRIPPPVGKDQPAQPPLERLLSSSGDYGLTLACAALFAPMITLDQGGPLARFGGSDPPTPIDCFHVDLLHHERAENRDPAVYRAIGVALAEAWSLRLATFGLPGRFLYDDRSGYDVVYESGGLSAA